MWTGHQRFVSEARGSHREPLRPIEDLGCPANTVRFKGQMKPREESSFPHTFESLYLFRKLKHLVKNLVHGMGSGTRGATV